MILPLVLALLTGDGRAIYEKGEGASPIVARISGGSEVPASALPCIGCHGADGRGKSEGGVTPSNITNAELTKPYEVTTANGRRRAPYTDALLRRAITMGVDSSGQHFDPLMPRFQMTRADLDQLVAYLHTLGTVDTPGVTEKTIRIAVARNSEIDAKVAAINAAGGIFGRMLEIGDEKPFVSVRDFAISGDAFVRRLAPGIVEQARALGRATRDVKNVAIVGGDEQPDAADAFLDGRAATGVAALLEADAVLDLRAGKTRMFVRATKTSVVAFAIPPRYTSGGIALAAIDVIAEAARLAGRDLTPQTFLSAIDQLRGFRTPYAPPLTWSPTHRIGWTTITVVTFDADGQVLDEHEVEGAP